MKWSTNREKHYYSYPKHCFIETRHSFFFADGRPNFFFWFDGQTHFHAFDISADIQICKFNLPWKFLPKHSSVRTNQAHLFKSKPNSRKWDPLSFQNLYISAHKKKEEQRTIWIWWHSTVLIHMMCNRLNGITHQILVESWVFG